MDHTIVVLRGYPARQSRDQQSCQPHLYSTVPLQAHLQYRTATSHLPSQAKSKHIAPCSQLLRQTCSMLTPHRRQVTIIDKDNTSHTFHVSDGDNLLDIAQANDLEMEGACGGSCACSTCHVIVDGADMYDKMDEPDDDENDMLDLAFGLTETSRLGCQIKMSKAMDGLVVRLPSMTRNLQASDFAKK